MPSFDIASEVDLQILDNAVNTVKKEIPVRNGLKQDDAKKIVKMIKDSGFKVQVAIMDDIIRVTGKKLDDLQEVIAKCRTDNFGIPLQFVNMKS